MSEERARQHLVACLQRVFDAIPVAKRRVIFEEMAFLETLAKEGVPAYVKRVNEEKGGE